MRAKSWPRNKGLISHSFLQLLGDFYNWLLNGGWPLNRWPLYGDSTVSPNMYVRVTGKMLYALKKALKLFQQ